MSDDQQTTKSTIDKPNNHIITPIKEENTQKSDISHASFSRSYIPNGGSVGGSITKKSQTYSNGGVDTVQSYSEIYESATRESIDETPDDIKQRLKGNNNKNSNKNGNKKTTQTTKQSITWTHKYTSEQINKSKNKIGWDELVNLEQLYALHMIDTIQYNERKLKLIDNMTGTRIANDDNDKYIDINGHHIGKLSKYIEEHKNPPVSRVLGETEIIKKIPNFNCIIPERAIRHSCIIQIVNDKKGEWVTKEKWKQDMRLIKMAKNPFNNGTLRLVYYMQDITDDINIKIDDNTATTASTNNTTSSTDDKTDEPIENRATHVAKISIDPTEEYDTYFHDVAMQNHAQRFADKFNLNDVPKKVGFLDCWVYELVDRQPHIFCGGEKFIKGNYFKYTNNWDWVNMTVNRNTPTAFSHFTYQASNKKIIICDLQGVGDLYTDPQMHTYNGKGCGKGNMGKRGIDKFLSSHKCNAICTYLKLQNTLSKAQREQLKGTLPQKRYMDKKKIDQIPVTQNGQYTIPETVIQRTTKSTGYHTSNNTQTYQQQLLYKNSNSDDDDDYDGPFGKFKLIDNDNDDDDDDVADNKCWCVVL